MSKGIVRFFREVNQEGKKVTWPNRKETIMTTIVVFIMILFAAIFLFVVDWAVSGLIELILGS